MFTRRPWLPAYACCPAGEFELILANAAHVKNVPGRKTDVNVLPIRPDTSSAWGSSTTAGLIALSEWLAENGCTQIAMEATGIYWKPVWHILADGEFELILANAAHVKNVPGR